MRELTLSCQKENLTLALDLLNGVLDQVACALQAQIQLQIALEEIFVNILRYAYPTGEGEVTLQVWTEEEPHRAIVRLKDRGLRFDPTAQPEPDITSPAEEREIGGLGIFLARKNVDQMDYEYKDGQNILTMTKII
jgi:anti-sigma regulatory factor (Ser/Thr protein kinase)